MQYDYGLWTLVVSNITLYLAFALAFLRPATRREWRSLGVLSAFVVALFGEMYGIPLTIYLVAGLLGRLPLDSFSHASGNLWASLLVGQQWAGLFMLGGGLLMGLGALLIFRGWRRVHRGQGDLVVTGIYGMVRHPQYTGLMIAVVGALIQWPTAITLLMAPVLVGMYYRLALREEAELLLRFGERYRIYRERTPAFLPSARAWLVGTSRPGNASPAQDEKEAAHGV